MSAADFPLVDHLDKVMARAVVQQSGNHIPEMVRRVATSDSLPSPRSTQWFSYLPGTSLPTVWRETHPEALAVLRALVAKHWVRTLQELQQAARYEQILAPTLSVRDERCQDPKAFEPAVTRRAR